MLLSADLFNSPHKFESEGAAGLVSHDVASGDASSSILRKQGHISLKTCDTVRIHCKLSPCKNMRIPIAIKTLITGFVTLYSWNA